jgi:hypothetical protein
LVGTPVGSILYRPLDGWTEGLELGSAEGPIEARECVLLGSTLVDPLGTPVGSILGSEDQLRAATAPPSRWTSNSLEDFSLFVILNLAQWPGSHDALIKAGSVAMDHAEGGSKYVPDAMSAEHAVIAVEAMLPSILQAGDPPRKSAQSEKACGEISQMLLTYADISGTSLTSGGPEVILFDRRLVVVYLVVVSKDESLLCVTCFLVVAVLCRMTRASFLLCCSLF